MTDEHLTKLHAVDKAYNGMRLDRFLTEKYPRISRARLQKCVKLGGIKHNGAPAKPNDKVLAGDEVSVDFRVLDVGQPPRVRVELDIIYEDEHLLAVDKPSGMVVHPVAKFRVNTLLDALRDRFGGGFQGHFANRLDQFTSGIVLVAKDAAAREKLQRLFENNEVGKEYLAFVEGRFEHERDTVDAPVGRLHPEKHLVTMAVKADGKPSRTEFERLKVFEKFSYVRARPRTGRQHQIRVHLAHLGHPVLCDLRYGRPDPLRDVHGKVLLDRCALHASKMSFAHPATGKLVEIVAPLPSDFERVLSSYKAIE